MFLLFISYLSFIKVIKQNSLTILRTADYTDNLHFSMFNVVQLINIFNIHYTKIHFIIISFKQQQIRNTFRTP